MDNQDPVPVAEVPGITFWVEASGVIGVTVDGKKTGYVRLRTEFDNEELWLEVVKRMNGLRVHAIDDFHSQILMALRLENEELTKELAKVTEQKRAGEEVAGQQLAQAGLQIQMLEESNRKLMQEMQASVSSAAVRDLELLLQQKA
jgi:hypothetical protein